MFKRLFGANEALRALLDRSRPIDRAESTATAASTGGVLAKKITSSIDLPGFNRAAMDGFAVRSSETRGASPLNPIYIDGFLPVRTGMAIPDGFDAVVMLEDSMLRGGELEVRAVAHPYRNVSRIGEDIKKGDTVLEEGHTIRPPDIALLSALGVESVDVYARPRVTIIPTGGELVAIGSRPLRPGEAYEINGLMARLYVKMWGGEPLLHGIVPDDLEDIRGAIESSLSADMVVVIGGTSVGEMDHAPRAVERLGEVLVHGVRIQPGKPTALGIIADKPVVCLPGYPVAALSALYLFVRPVLKRLSHMDDAAPRVCAKLAGKITSRPGYLSIVRVALEGDRGDRAAPVVAAPVVAAPVVAAPVVAAPVVAVPIMSSGAGILSSVARADGFVAVPEEKEGIEPGEMVDVNLFE